MKSLFEDNPTRKNIILLLRKSGGMSIEELSKIINITPMGIRQHLLALENKGFVAYTAKKHGIGRPGFIYRLTEMADELFPKSYDSFAIGILKDIEKHEGREKIDKIFKWRRERLFNLRKDALPPKADIEETLSGLKNLLESEGYLVELTRHNGSYHLTQYNCPINRVAVEFNAACAHELQLYRDLIRKDITRKHSLSDGSNSCLYLIPAV